MFGDVTGHEVVILFDVGHHRRQPLFAVIVGRFHGHQAEGVGPKLAVPPQRLRELLAFLFIWDDDVRDLQPGQVEGLAGRSAGDAFMGEALVDGGEGSEVLVAVDEVAVYFVSHHQGRRFPGISGRNGSIPRPSTPGRWDYGGLHKMAIVSSGSAAFWARSSKSMT